MPTLRVAIDARGSKVGAEQHNRAVRQMTQETRRSTQSTDRFDRTLDKAGRTSRGTARQVDRLGRQHREAGKAAQFQERQTRQLSSTSQKLGRNLTALFGGLSAALVLRQSISTFSAFEETMATVQGVTRASADEFERLQETARQLGATTRFTASQSGEALLFLARAGFDVQESLDAVGATLNLAAAGNIDLGEAADFASNILSQFNLAASQTTRVVDTLVSTSNRSNTNVRQLAESMKLAGPVAGALRIDVETTAAAIGALGDSGIQASLAGTNLRGILAALLQPTSRATQALGDMNLTVRDVSPATNDLVEVIRSLADANLDAEKAVAIFGRRNAAAALILANSVDKVDELTEANRDATGEAQRMADVMNDTLAGSLRTLVSALQEATLATAEQGLAGGFRTLIDLSTDVVRSLAGVEAEVITNAATVNAIADSIRLLTRLLLTLLAVKVAQRLGAIVIKLVNLRRALAALTALAAKNPIGLLFVGISIAIVELTDLEDRLLGLNRTLSESDRLNNRYSASVESMESALDQASEAGKRFEKAVEDANAQMRQGAINQQLSAIEQFTQSLNEQADVNRLRELQKVESEIVEAREKQTQLAQSQGVGGVGVFGAPRRSLGVSEGGLPPGAPTQDEIRERLDQAADAVTVEMSELRSLVQVEGQKFNELLDEIFGPVLLEDGGRVRANPNRPAELPLTKALKLLQQQAEMLKQENVAAELDRINTAGSESGSGGIENQTAALEEFIVQLEQQRQQIGLTREQTERLSFVEEARQVVLESGIENQEHQVRLLVEEFDAQRQLEQQLEQTNEAVRDQARANDALSEMFGRLQRENAALQDTSADRRRATELLKLEAAARRAGVQNVDETVDAYRRLANANDELRRSQESRLAVEEQLRDTRDSLQQSDQFLDLLRSGVSPEDARVQQQLMQDRMEFLNNLENSNLSPEESQRQLLVFDEAQSKLLATNEQINGILERRRELAQFSDDMAEALVRPLTDFLQGAASVEEAIGRIALRMSELAVQQTVVQPLLNSASTGFSSILGPLFSGGGNANARGDVFDRSSRFVDSSGRPQLLGERGPEGVLPLGRTRDGDLGVKFAGTLQGGQEQGNRQVTINMPVTITTPNADSFRRSQSQITRNLRRAAGSVMEER